MTEETAPAPDTEAPAPDTEPVAEAPAPDTEAVAEPTEEPAAEDKPKKKKKTKKKTRRGNRAPRKPTFKDWIRVINSQGNACANTTVHVIYNEATSVCTLVTNAPAKEGSEEMEGERRQIFKVTSHEVIDIPDPEPAPEPAPAPPAEEAAT